MSLITTIAASAKPAEAGGAPSSAIVSGAGTAAANGTYTERGTFTSKPFYTLDGQPTPPDPSADPSSLFWSGDSFSWVISGDLLYISPEFEDTAFPWLATEWIESTGDSPPPIVSEG